MKKIMPALTPLWIGLVLFPLVLFAGFAFWKTNSYEEAVLILGRLDNAQKAEILSTCQSLMTHVDSSKKLIEKSPFDFMKIDFIRLSQSTCEVFLYKGPGKGVGYVVNKQGKQKPEFYWFNNYENWDHHPIEL
jgi:hypothetical protein